MKNRLFTFFLIGMTLWGALSATGCSDSKTYAERLAEEQDAIRAFLSDKKTSSVLPEDGNFDPNIYYNIGSGVFMQVVRPGNLELKAEDEAVVLFRYKYTDLFTDETTDVNWNTSTEDSNYQPSVLFYNTSTSITTYGEGIQMPLKYVGEEAIVNVLVPSKKGTSANEGTVTPILYLVRITSITNR